MADEAIIEKDRRSNPNCSYAISSQQHCSNSKDSFVCETLRTITRQCPNTPPVVIFRKTDQNIGNDLAPNYSKDFGNIFGHRQNDGLFGMFGTLQSFMDMIMEDSKGFKAGEFNQADFPPRVQDRRPLKAPHKSYFDGNEQLSDIPLPRSPGKVQGPIEQV